MGQGESFNDVELCCAAYAFLVAVCANVNLTECQQVMFSQSSIRIYPNFIFCCTVVVGRKQALHARLKHCWFTNCLTYGFEFCNESLVGWSDAEFSVKPATELE